MEQMFHVINVQILFLDGQTRSSTAFLKSLPLDVGSKMVRRTQESWNAPDVECLQTLRVAGSTGNGKMAVIAWPKKWPTSYARMKIIYEKQGVLLYCRNKSGCSLNACSI